MWQPATMYWSRANAGAGIGATDDDYRKAGATILSSAREVFASSEMIVKVKEPQPPRMAHSCERIKSSSLIFIWRLTRNKPRALKSRCTAIAYETVTDAHGGLSTFGADERSRG